MWVFVEGAFVSIVQHRTRPGTLLVRARRREDLERFLRSPGGVPVSAPIEATPDADYPFRALCPRESVLTLLAAHATAIDYDNFKAAPGNADRQPQLMRIWAAARGLEAVREGEYTIRFD